MVSLRLSQALPLCPTPPFIPYPTSRAIANKTKALILQHFERGPKLNDSSNRYEHTCKGCGEKFPKGRIDSLTAHILKKCVAMRDQDRQRAQLEFSQMNDLQNQVHGHNGEVQMKGKTVDLPIVNRNWSALETLAEVSRQIDMNEHKHDGPQTERAAGMGGPSESSRADRLELQEQYTLDNPPVSYEQRVLRDRKGMYIFPIFKLCTLTFQSCQPKVQPRRK